MVTTNVGRYQPNAWGLCDMIGNAAEWTRTAYRPYPYRGDDGRDDPAAAGARSSAAVRGMIGRIGLPRRTACITSRGSMSSTSASASSWKWMNRTVGWDQIA